MTVEWDGCVVPWRLASRLWLLMILALGSCERDNFRSTGTERPQPASERSFSLPSPIDALLRMNRGSEDDADERRRAAAVERAAADVPAAPPWALGKRSPSTAATTSSVSTAPATHPASADDQPKRVTVFYGTSRRPVVTPERVAYGPDVDIDPLDDKVSLHVGVCTVSIPPRHAVGQIERPRWYEVREDERRHFVIESISPKTPTEFGKGLMEALAAASSQDVLLFVHGFNNTFDDAAYRTAQVWKDLGFKGAAAMYSWPAYGRTRLYAHDEDAVTLAVPSFIRFVRTLRDTPGVGRIFLIAHSMGNRLVTTAAQHMVAEQMTSESLGWADALDVTVPDEPVVIDVQVTAASSDGTAAAPSAFVFEHYVMAAPDVNALQFRSQLFAPVRMVARHVTLLASSDDMALQTSMSLHDYPRLGQGWPHLTVLPHLTTLDATGIDTDLMGHAYWGDCEQVIERLKLLVIQGQPPAQPPLFKYAAGGQAYWGLLQRRTPRLLDGVRVEFLLAAVAAVVWMLIVMLLTARRRRHLQRRQKHETVTIETRLGQVKRAMQILGVLRWFAAALAVAIALRWIASLFDSTSGAGLVNFLEWLMAAMLVVVVVGVLGINVAQVIRWCRA